MDYPFVERFTTTPWGEMYSRSAELSTNSQVTVILVPGMIISSSYMIPLALELAPYCNVHMIDFPGYGKSEKPKNIVLNISELAEALQIWMTSNAIAKAALIGNSFGCQIIAEFAARYPELIDRVVLQGPTVDPAARSVLRQMIRLKLNSMRESKSAGLISVKDYRAAGLSRVIKTIRMTMQDRIETKLPQIRVRTLVVRGDRDPVVPQEWAEQVTQLIPNSELCVIPGAAHILNYSEPKKFSRVILHFLGLSYSGADG